MPQGLASARKKNDPSTYNKAREDTMADSSSLRPLSFTLLHKIVALIATDLLFSPFPKRNCLDGKPKANVTNPFGTLVKVHVKVLISTFITTQILAYDIICQKHCQVVTNRVTVLVTSQEFRTGTTSYFRFPVQAIPQNCSYGSLII